MTGRRARHVAGVGMGEILVVRDQSGEGEKGEEVMEGWEAWRRGKGGEVVCRVG